MTTRELARQIQTGVEEGFSDARFAALGCHLDELAERFEKRPSTDPVVARRIRTAKRHLQQAREAVRV